MRRLGALLGAIAMVVAAFAVRDALGGDDAEDGVEAEASGLVCPPELQEACRRTGEPVRTETAGTTADRLVGAEGAAALDAAAWIVPAAWARLVVAERERLGHEARFEVADGPLASSPVVLTVWSDTAEELGVRCGRPVDWRCVAEQAGQVVAGNPVRPGGPEVDSAAGLTVAAAQAAALLGTSDFAANDFDTGDFRTLADRLAGGQGAEPLRAMRTQGPGRYSAAGTLAAAAGNLSNPFGTIVAHDDREPRVRADVVALVPVGAELDPGVRDAVADALLDAGWGPSAEGPDGLPAGGVLAALRTMWNERR